MQRCRPKARRTWTRTLPCFFGRRLRRCSRLPLSQCPAEVSDLHALSHKGRTRDDDAVAGPKAALDFDLIAGRGADRYAAAAHALIGPNDPYHLVTGLLFIYGGNGNQDAFGRSAGWPVFGGHSGRHAGESCYGAYSRRADAYLKRL